MYRFKFFINISDARDKSIVAKNVRKHTGPAIRLSVKLITRNKYSKRFKHELKYLDQLKNNVKIHKVVVPYALIILLNSFYLKPAGPHPV